MCVMPYRAHVTASTMVPQVSEPFQSAEITERRIEGGLLTVVRYGEVHKCDSREN